MKIIGAKIEMIDFNSEPLQKIKYKGPYENKNLLKEPSITSETRQLHQHNRKKQLFNHREVIWVTITKRYLSYQF